MCVCFVFFDVAVCASSRMNTMCVFTDTPKGAWKMAYIKMHHKAQMPKCQKSEDAKPGLDGYCGDFRCEAKSLTN